MRPSSFVYALHCTEGAVASSGRRVGARSRGVPIAWVQRPGSAGMGRSGTYKDRTGGYFYRNRLENLKAEGLTMGFLAVCSPLLVEGEGWAGSDGCFVNRHFRHPAWLRAMSFSW
jgi:hypothetical protein